ncbi:hypothetical protein ACJX0J_027091, partial [Zea mays]
TIRSVEKLADSHDPMAQGACLSFLLLLARMCGSSPYSFYGNYHCLLIYVPLYHIFVAYGYGYAQCDISNYMIAVALLTAFVQVWEHNAIMQSGSNLIAEGNLLLITEAIWEHFEMHRHISSTSLFFLIEYIFLLGGI